MSMTYLEVTAAERWRMPPSAFYELSEEDRALMVAKVRADGKRQAAEAYHYRPKEKVRR